MDANYVTNFLNLMQQFLDAMHEVFPECPRVFSIRAAYHLKTRGKTSEELQEFGQQAIREYHAVMEPWYKRCELFDESLLQEDIKFMRDLNLRDKWTEELHPDTQATIWEYIQNLNRCSMILDFSSTKMPQNLMNTLNDKARNLLETNQNVSFQDVLNLSYQVIGESDPNELRQASQQVMGNYETLLSMAMNSMKMFSKQ